MFTKIDLDNGYIFYQHIQTKLRNYIYTYFNPINEVQSQIEVSIWFYSKEEKFIVKIIGNDELAFDTYKDADLYAIKKIFDYKMKLEEETEEIKKYIEKKNKKKNKGD